MISEKVAIFGASTRYLYIFSDLSLYTQVVVAFFCGQSRLVMVVMALVNRFVQTFNKPVADTYWSVLENVAFYMQEQKIKFKWLDHSMKWAVT